MKLRHVGIVVSDLERSIQMYEKMGFHPVSLSMLRVAKMQDNEGGTIELVQGPWKSHVAVTFYEDEDKNLLEVVNEHPNHSGSGHKP